MRRYVQLACDYFVRTDGWPKDAKWLYLWSWTNEHVDGVSGIGRVPDRTVRHETGLSPKQLDNAWDFLTEKAKVRRYPQDWYWVVERPRYTCWTADDMLNDTKADSLYNQVNDPELPQAIRDDISQEYAALIHALSIPLEYPIKTPAKNALIAQRKRKVGEKERKKEAKKERKSPSKEKESVLWSGAEKKKAIPADLKALELYEQDERLCGAWQHFKAAALEAYPGVDFLAAVRAAHAWEVANPEKRKKNRTRFLNNWLAREQDKGGGGGSDVGHIF